MAIPAIDRARKKPMPISPKAGEFQMAALPSGPWPTGA